MRGVGVEIVAIGEEQLLSSTFSISRPDKPLQHIPKFINGYTAKTRETKNKDGSGEGLFFENTAILSLYSVSICIKLKLYMYFCYISYVYIYISGKPVPTADCQALLLDKQIESLQRYYVNKED